MIFDRANSRFPNATLYGKGPSPNGVDQGSLGDCYFLSSCASASEVPSRIKNVFVTNSLNPEGIIVARVMILGKPTTIYVDDYLPFRGTSKNLYFASMSENGLWMAFLEKLWAKTCGYYEKIESGYASEAVRFLTGAPSKHFGHESP